MRAATSEPDPSWSIVAVVRIAFLIGRILFCPRQRGLPEGGGSAMAWDCGSDPQLRTRLDSAAGLVREGEVGIL